jgi:septal ring factor EnvC (AmiA/AmiB activator)
MSTVRVEDVDKFVDAVSAHVKQLNTKIYIADEKLVRCHKGAKKSSKKIEKLEKTIEILEKNKEIVGGLVSNRYMADRYDAILDERIREIDSYDFDAFEREFEKELNI